MIIFNVLVIFGLIASEKLYTLNKLLKYSVIAISIWLNESYECSTKNWLKQCYLNSIITSIHK